ncbi:MAG: hypothetical protein BWY38_03200 [Ignavibacteria bacterium ADurb.Bin266]|nr:MAG: hypothetical protein BWY38_03200 [Ignavibacteria bacterium ADurb.Bin266]
MKRVMSIIITFFILSAAILAVPNDKSAVDFVKKIINLAVNGEQGYLNALRYFQYTATTAKNNPSSYILSPYGKSALAESGISVSDKGKMIPVLKNRSGKRITALWNENKNELLSMFTVEQYNAFLKSDVDSFIEFHDSHDYKKLMQKLKKKNPRPDTNTINRAGDISGWSKYKEMAFWHRRIYEKNDDAVYSILKELKTHYSR